jgi:hypothetical protein
VGASIHHLLIGELIYAQGVGAVVDLYVIDDEEKRRKSAKESR